MAGPIWYACLVLGAIFGGIGAATAQTVGPDEAVDSHGVVAGKIALSPAQKNAIYNAVVQQRARATTMRVAATVGAPVSPLAELAALPDPAGIDGAGALKYVMVENDVVVVDPLRMRVVDIIRGTSGP